VKVILRVILIGGSLYLGCGCGSSSSDIAAAFQDEDPARRIEAVALAGRNRDQSAVPFLIDRLTDSQEEVRFFAIIALKRATGETMGWNYYDPPAKRAEAVRRWREWLQDQRKDSTRQEARTAQEAISR